jgi:hypothetical protein
MTRHARTSRGHWLLLATGSCALAACGGESVYFIPGSAQLPDCEEAPIANLDGTRWFDTGTVTVLSQGCADAQPNDVFTVCALDWDFTQDGNEVTIVVDNEYRIEGRLCGDQLHLRGGWWLPVQDQGVCTYDDDSAQEVGILEGGNTLTVSPQQMSGTLALRGECDGSYEITFQPSPR